MKGWRHSDIQTVKDDSVVAAATALGWSAIKAIGDMDILAQPRLGLLCSQRCPGDLILQTYDLVRVLRDQGITVAGGFHSPMEKECLDLLLRGTQPLVICPARSIEKMRIPKDWQEAIRAGRLLVLSPFGPDIRRVTKKTALRRNQFVAAIADELLVPHASPEGEVEALCREILADGKKVYTLESKANDHLMTLGAQPFDRHQFIGRFLELNGEIHRMKDLSCS